METNTEVEISSSMPEAQQPAEQPVQPVLSPEEERQKRISEMRMKYGDNVCPFCKAFVRQHKACGWKFAAIIPKRVIKSLKEVESRYGKIQYCELFQQRANLPKKGEKRKSEINWRERIKDTSYKAPSNFRTGRAV